MSLLSWFRGEQREVQDVSTLPSPRFVHPMADWWYMPASHSSTGITVTPENAQALPTVFACCRVLAETIASLPIPLYREIPGGKERATDHPLYRLVGFRPNGWQTRAEFFDLMTGWIALRGNAYAYIVRNGRGDPTELRPMHPNRVETKLRTNGTKYHIYTDNDGDKYELKASEVLHVYGYSDDGITGMSPISANRKAVELALATQEMGASFFNNDATPGGIITAPKAVTEQQQKNLKESWSEKHKGVRKKFRVAVLEEGMQWQQIGLSFEDSQWMQARQMGREDVCAIYRMPPHLVGDLSRATFGNIEEQGLNFATYTMLAWNTRWEQRLTMSLVPEKLWGTLYFEFLIDALLRGNTIARYQAYGTAIDHGFMNKDEARARENLNPIRDGLGQEFVQPLNMAVLGEANKPDEKPEPQPAKLTLVKNEQPERNSEGTSLEAIKFAYSRALEDAAARVIRRESSEVLAAGKKINFADSNARASWCDSWVEKYRSHAASAIESIIHTALVTLYAHNRSDASLCPTMEEAKDLARICAHDYGEDSEFAIMTSRSADDLAQVTREWERDRAKLLAERWLFAIFKPENESKNGTTDA